MKIIADSGTTKTVWVFLENDNVVKTLTTLGYNPYYYDVEILQNILEDEISPQIGEFVITNVHFYGSGCSTIENCKKVELAISRIFESSDITIDHDLNGAAKALLGNNEGIACILGTGSNSCLWTGNTIKHNVPSVGYLLGDEGSGTYLGMKIMKGILEDKAPQYIIDAYYEEYSTNFENTLRKIYDSHQPNRYFAEISKFAGKYIDDEWIYSCLQETFGDFFSNTVSTYPDYQKYIIAFTGSVAFHYREILVKLMNDKGLRIGKILKDPMEGLIDYHRAI